jgi:hypothetical protein
MTALKNVFESDSDAAFFLINAHRPLAFGSGRIGQPSLENAPSGRISSANHTSNKVFEDALRTMQIWRRISGGYACSETW